MHANRPRRSWPWVLGFLILVGAGALLGIRAVRPVLKESALRELDEIKARAGAELSRRSWQSAEARRGYGAVMDAIRRLPDELSSWSADSAAYERALAAHATSVDRVIADLRTVQSRGSGPSLESYEPGPRDDGCCTSFILRLEDHHFRGSRVDRLLPLLLTEWRATCDLEQPPWRDPAMPGYRLGRILGEHPLPKGELEPIDAALADCGAARPQCGKLSKIIALTYLYELSGWAREDISMAHLPTDS